MTDRDVKWLQTELRKISLRWRERIRALNKAKRITDDGFYKNGNRKTKVKYYCQSCANLFNRDGVHVDHVKPIGEFVDFDSFTRDLFCSVNNLQVLCVKCHKEKSAHEKRTGAYAKHKKK